MEYPLALVQPYPQVSPTSNPALQKDIDLRFLRLSKARDQDTEIVFVQSFVRGAVLIPAYDIDNHFLVFDVLDCDMAVRVREILAEVA